MKTLFGDPAHWAAQAVGNKTRFILLLGLLAGLTGITVLTAAHDGLSAALGLGLLLVWAQFMLLYALRSLHLRLLGQAGKPRAASSQG